MMKWVKIEAEHSIMGGTSKKLEEKWIKPPEKKQGQMLRNTC